MGLFTEPRKLGALSAHVSSGVTKPCAVPAERSFYLYPWDVTAWRAPALAERLHQLGMSSATLALAYHTGKFLRPPAWGESADTATRRVVFAEDGVCYFRPHEADYGEIRPRAAEDQALLDALSQLAQHLPVRGWLVLLHNTRLGLQHPAYTARNAWGDGYCYSLCPSHEAVREYALQLSLDAARQPVTELVLETPGWLPYPHGYHHEFAQVRSNVWLEALLGQCFCSACLHAAKKAGIDAERLRAMVRQWVDDYLVSGVDAAPEQAAAWLHALDLTQPDWAAWLRLRCERVTTLVTRIRTAVMQQSGKRVWVIPTVQRPAAAAQWVEGSDAVALARAADGLELPCYEPDAERVLAQAWQLQQTLHQALGASVRLRVILRPGTPDLAHGAELPQALTGLHQLGLHDLSFYHFGLLRPGQLDALGVALAALD